MNKLYFFIVVFATCRPIEARADDADVLARVAVLEAGFASRSDHLAIWYVLEKRAKKHNVTLTEMAFRYSSPMKKTMPNWALSAPKSLWSQVVRHARLFLDKKTHNPCPQADHWGNRHGDSKRALEAGWQQVRCGKTLNLFWKVK